MLRLQLGAFQTLKLSGRHTHITHSRVVQESWAPGFRRGGVVAHGELVMEGGAPPSWAWGRFPGVDTGPGV